MFAVVISGACYFFLIFLTVFTSSADFKISEKCPAACTCVVIHIKDISPKEWSKVECNKSLFETTDLENLRLHDIKPPIIQLQITMNLTRLNKSFLKLYSLEKLSLSRNDIEEIDNDAFTHLKNLKRLDLSYNKITSLQKKMFEPLTSLERLKLNNNLIVHIFKGVFDHLISLKALDISENPLDCDCTLLWIMEWSKNSSVKLKQLHNCKTILSSKGKPPRKLKLHCEDDLNPYSKSSELELKPMHNQIVFEGDSLSLRCRSLRAGGNVEKIQGAQVTWSWKNKDPSVYFDKIKIESKSFAENGFIESQLKIDKIQKSHSGDWYCHLVSESGNHSTAISVIVLSEDSKYCPQIYSKNNKGIYFWPKTIVGFTVDLPCDVRQPSIVGNKAKPRAMYTCNETGFWEKLNTTQCPYVSETTRILEQFSQVNLSIAKGSVLDSALKLRNFTGNGENLTDAMDIVFISKTVENYLVFVKNDRELGYVLLDIIATIMKLSKNLLLDAQKENSACSRLVRCVEIISKDIPTFQLHKSNLVVEEFGGIGAFSGIRCVWYINAQTDKSPKRFFHCSTNNRTTSAGSHNRIIDASIQIPASLFTQLEAQGTFTHNIWQLVVSMFENNNLFPDLTDLNEEVTSCVIGSRLVGLDVTNLTEPVYIMLRAPKNSPSVVCKPVRWDQFRNNGSGGWTEDGCQLLQYTQGMILFQCNRLGYFGLLQDTQHLTNYSERYHNRLHLSHPAIYTGSFILIICLLISVVTYLFCHSFIQMSRRAKHSIVNTWISITLLCFIFSCGIHQTNNSNICQGVGILLHYFFLSTLLWMSVSVSNMYKRLSKSDPMDNAPEDDLPPGVPIQKPILGLYLVGWGIGLIVCGISGAVNLKEYAGQNFCFLESGPALSAVYVPAGMLLAFLILFYILTLCAIRNNDLNGQLSEGTQGTENVDLELLEVPAPALNLSDRRSVQSFGTTDSDDIEDPEHSPIIQLKAHVIVLTFYVLLCSLVVLSLMDSFQDTIVHHQDICSILYCILSFCLGAFVLYFYCVARSDVRSQWTVIKKVLKGEKILCCRSRSVSDTQVNVQVGPTSGLTNGSTVRPRLPALSSSSLNSSGPTGKTNSHKSNRAKAVKKLNHCDSRKEPNVALTTANNVNLVAMHRQIYRSNNSTPTYHEIFGPNCVEAFYNPRQSIVARKFFKKQRRNKRNDLGLRKRGDGGGTSEGEASQARRTWRPSAESAVFLSSDMEKMESEKVESNYFGYGPKLNGLNSHAIANMRHKNSQITKGSNTLTNSDDENKNNRLPLDRLVIGAEEDKETSSSRKNNISLYDFGLNRVDEISASEVDLTAVLPADENASPQEADGNSPNYKTVELQCSLGENSCSDLYSESNYCNCPYNETTSNCSKQEEDMKNLEMKERVEDTSLISSVGPYIDSFNEKIDALRFHSYSSLCESPECKKKIPDSPTKSLNSSSIRSCYTQPLECEQEALIDAEDDDDNDEEEGDNNGVVEEENSGSVKDNSTVKEKKETSV